MNGKRFLPMAAGLIAATLIGLLLLWADATQAQVSPTHNHAAVGPALVVTDTDKMIWDAEGTNPGDDTNPDVAYNSHTDEHLVVFEWPDEVGRDIASILVDADGQAAYSPNGVAISDAYTDTNPAVAYNPTDNNYLAVWEREAPTGEKFIHGAILNPSGTFSKEVAIASWAGDQVYPDVAYSTASGLYLVVWEDHYPTWTNEPNLYGRSMDGLGDNKQWVFILGDVAGGQTLPAVAANNANGRWMVTWRDSRDSATTNDDIYGKQVASSGNTTWGGQVPIATVAGWASAPDVAWGQVGSGDGEFLAVWSENETMYARRIQANNVLLSEAITVSSHLTSNKYIPAVTYNAVERKWWTVWEDNRDKG